MYTREEEEELRFLRWVETMHNFAITEVPVFIWKTVRDTDRYGRATKRRRKVFSHYDRKGVGPGIDEPTQQELDAVLSAPCRYRRATRAARS